MMGRSAGSILWGLAAVAAIGAGLWWWSLGPGAGGSAVDQDPVARAWASVHDRPTDPSAWSRLAEVQAEADHLVEAEHAYRTALRLGDDSGLAYARLGFLIYGQGRDEEARVLLLEARRRGAEVPMLDFTLAALETSGQPEPAREPPGEPAVSTPPSPPRPGLDAGSPTLDASFAPPRAPPPPVAAPAPPAQPPEPSVAVSAPQPLRPSPEGPCSLRLRRHGRVLLVDVWIDGAEATLLLDTGASMTVVTEQLAQRVGIRIDSRRVIHALTANGKVVMPTGVASIGVGPYPGLETRVAVCNDCVQGYADGLLGLDLQVSFRMELDLAAERLRFSDCE